MKKFQHINTLFQFERENVVKATKLIIEFYHSFQSLAIYGVGSISHSFSLSFFASAYFLLFNVEAECYKIYVENQHFMLEYLCLCVFCSCFCVCCRCSRGFSHFIQFLYETSLIHI